MILLFSNYFDVNSFWWGQGNDPKIGKKNLTGISAFKSRKYYLGKLLFYFSPTCWYQKYLRVKQETNPVWPKCGHLKLHGVLEIMLDRYRGVQVWIPLFPCKNSEIWSHGLWHQYSHYISKRVLLSICFKLSLKNMGIS